MKRRTLKQLGVLAAALTLVTTSLLGGTLAKYTSEASATGTATVAKWDFNVNNGTGDTFALNLVPAKYSNVTDKKIAPGTSGYFKIDATNGSEVDADYTISFTATQKPANLEFYTSNNGTLKNTKIEAQSGKYTVNGGTIVKGTTAAQSTYVMWDWPIGTDVESDQATIAAGNYDMEVVVTVIGTQATPTVSTP